MGARASREKGRFWRVMQVKCGEDRGIRLDRGELREENYGGNMWWTVAQRQGGENLGFCVGVPGWIDMGKWAKSGERWGPTGQCW